MYLYEKQSNREEGKETERQISSTPGSFSQLPQQPGLGQVKFRSQEFHAGLPCGILQTTFYQILKHA